MLDASAESRVQKVAEGRAQERRERRQILGSLTGHTSSHRSHAFVLSVPTFIQVVTYTQY